MSKTTNILRQIIHNYFILFEPLQLLILGKVQDLYNFSLILSKLLELLTGDV